MDKSEADPAVNPSIAVIYHQISAVNLGMGELKGMLISLDERMRAHELSEAASQAREESKLDAAHERLDDMESDLEKKYSKRGSRIAGLDERIKKIELKMPLVDDILNIRVKLIVWVFISGFLGTTISGLILALLFNFVFGGFAT